MTVPLRSPDPLAPVVYVVDDSVAVRQSVAFLLGILDVEVRTLENAEQFLQAYRPGVPGCLILDVRMPGISGLELQERLRRGGVDLPVIFVSGHGDIPMAVRAMRSGAVDFLTKPYNDQQLLDLVQRAIEQDRQRHARRRERTALEARRALLTPREAEVMALVVDGQTSKQIAQALAISVKTVETHRARLMAKMRADNIAELCQAHRLLQSPDGLSADEAAGSG